MELDTNRLKQLRRRWNENQTEVAKNLNLSREAYSMYETGKRQPPYETLQAMRDHFHVSTDYLLGITDISFSFTDLDSREQFIVRSLPLVDDRTKDFLLTVIRLNLREELPYPPDSSACLRGPEKDL